MRLFRSVAFGLIVLALPGLARAADQVVFLVRHAERGATPAAQPSSHQMMADDPPLSAAGQERAARLATMLSSAGIKHIFTTEYLRTRQTAQPLAQRLKLRAVMAAAKDPAPLAQQIRKVTGNVLIVGHSNTIPDLLKRLGVKEAVTIGENDYDQVFVVVLRAAAEPTLIRLHY